MDNQEFQDRRSDQKKPDQARQEGYQIRIPRFLQNTDSSYRENRTARGYGEDPNRRVDPSFRDALRQNERKEFYRRDTASFRENVGRDRSYRQEERNSFRRENASGISSGMNADFRYRDRQNPDYRNTARQTGDYRNTARQAGDYRTTTRQTGDYRNTARQTNDYRNSTRQTSDYRNSARQTGDYRNSTGQGSTRYSAEPRDYRNPGHASEYRTFTSQIPDYRNYSGRNEERGESWPERARRVYPELREDAKWDLTDRRDSYRNFSSSYSDRADRRRDNELPYQRRDLNHDRRYQVSQQYGAEDDIDEFYEEDIDPDFSDQEDFKNRKRAQTERKGYSAGVKVLLVLAVLLTIVAGSGFFYYHYVLSQVSYANGKDHAISEPVPLTTVDPLAEFDPDSVKWNQETIYRHEEGVHNFLLVGEENYEHDERGRTDAIMILTMNENDHAIRLSSIMRDSYVQIPDYEGNSYKDNKINVAYTLGGMTLMMKTVEENFNIQLDGYAKVDYDGFETIIDALGGVTITLGEEEAEYLNTTNYISKKKYRNVKAGTQVLNGNQALGYSRIRKAPTAKGTTDDWGRTERQRNVLNALFEAYKDKNIVELMLLLPKMMRLVTTDLDKNQITYLLLTVVKDRPRTLETKNFPVGGAFDTQIVPGVGDSLVLDFDKNIEALHGFVFGDEPETETGINENGD